MIELKPCPFCGGTRNRLAMSDIGKVWWRFCEDCRACGPVYAHDQNGATEAWNTRADSALVESLETLVA